jgi:hypothetical protein
VFRPMLVAIIALGIVGARSAAQETMPIRPDDGSDLSQAEPPTRDALRGLPRAESPIQGNAPPGEEEGKPTPGWLDRALGLEDWPVDVYGWVQNSFTGNANGRPKNGMDFGVFPNRLADQWQGNQFYVVVENPLEEHAQVNLGFRVDTLFGNDWQFTKDLGLFDRAFKPNAFVGLDFPQIYGDIHLPVLTKGGLDIKGGRFYSIAGYEQVAAIGRPLLSVTYMNNFTPFTFIGTQTTLHLTDRVDLYNAAVNGSDRWIDSRYQWGYIGGLSWESRSRTTNISLVGMALHDQLPRFPPVDQPLLPNAVPIIPSLAGRNNPFYGSSVRSYGSAVLSHEWNERLTQVVEADFVFDPSILGFNRSGKAQAIGYYGFANWFLYDITEELRGTWRMEVFRDQNGAATGVADTFYEATLGIQWKPKDWLWIRQDVRYDWAQFTKPYNDGTRGSQVTLSFDIIVRF